MNLNGDYCDMPIKGICVAVEADGGFGLNQTIPWDIPEEFQHFKDTVSDGMCVCGKTTFEDMYKLMINPKTGKLYKNCIFNKVQHIIVSSDTEFTCSDELRNMVNECTIKPIMVNSISAAIKTSEKLDNTKDIWFIGGKRIFHEALEYCDIVLMTVIPACYKCDTWFSTDKLRDMYVPTLEKHIHTSITPPLPVIKWERKKSA